MNKWIQCREFIARQGKKSEMRTGGEGGVKEVIFKICLSTDGNDPLQKNKIKKKKKRKQNLTEKREDNEEKAMGALAVLLNASALVSAAIKWGYIIPTL